MRQCPKCGREVEYFYPIEPVTTSLYHHYPSGLFSKLCEVPLSLLEDD